MIELVNVCKDFDKTPILTDINLTIPEGQVFGLIGTNGAGKSTLLRTLTGIYKPTKGQVTIQGEPIYNNPKAKLNFFYVPDDLYFFQGATPKDLANYYLGIYPDFDKDRYLSLLDTFHLKSKKRISTNSKGMKRQIAILAAICANTPYVFLDETFDGLDPLIRKAIKTLLVNEMESRGMTTIITSHNLREQEDICDHVCVLHQGNIVLSKDLLALKCSSQKVEVCFQNDQEAQEVLSQFTILKEKQKGFLYQLIIQGDREEVMEAFNQVKTTYLEIIPLSLEEIFITEMEGIGYDIQALINS